MEESTVLPYQYFLRDLGRVSDHLLPVQTRGSYLDMLGLTGDQPDGKTLTERFIGGEVAIMPYTDFLQFFGGLYGIMGLAGDESMGRSRDNMAEDLLKSMAAVVTAQLEREGNICTLTWNLADSFKARPDLVDPALIPLHPPQI